MTHKGKVRAWGKAKVGKCKTPILEKLVKIMYIYQ